jgi:NAD(P)-dependent dehydrogenase (short-subunit alcohol dehydrogenase family)
MTALIVGASRGLGLALAQEYLKRGWNVIATERSPQGSGLHDLQKKSQGHLEIETIDITNVKQIAELRKRLAQKKLDFLFVNAGVANGPKDRFSEVTDEEFLRVMLTNALSPMRIVEALENLVGPSGTIGVMSSALGSVSRNTTGGWEVYRASKAALNTLMRSFYARHSQDARTYLVMSPGWVRTEMGGAEAPLSMEESIPSFVDTVTKASSTRGVQYLDYNGQTVAW